MSRDCLESLLKVFFRVNIKKIYHTWYGQGSRIVRFDNNCHVAEDYYDGFFLDYMDGCR